MTRRSKSSGGQKHANRASRHVKHQNERREPRFDSSPEVKPPKRGRRNKTQKSRSGAKRRQQANRQTKKRGSILFRIARWCTYWCFVVGIWAAIGAGGVLAYYGARMPNAQTWEVPTRPPNVKIVSMRGKEMANRGATGGEARALSDISPYIPLAVMAIEDRRFYSHFGVDPLGLARAFITNIIEGRTVQGGSTLTQQLAKNLFLSPERSIERKVQEVLLAFWLENKFTKDQILEMYLNRVYFGAGAYGVEAAARRYYQKSARNVNLSEAATLAGLLKAPSRLSPKTNPKAANARSQIVLSSMEKVGFITEQEALTALTQSPSESRSYWTGSEHYVADRVMDQLAGLVGTIDQDLIIETTLDFDLQKSAEDKIRTTIAKNSDALAVSEAALVTLDGTGATRALIGGQDYAVSQFNRATGAKRQPGSAFKPFVYVAALERGYVPTTMQNDTLVKIGKWSPQNYDETYRGLVTLDEALSSSINTVAARLTYDVGPRNVVRTAQRLGIKSKLTSNASIALGTSEVTLLELTSAYGPFMNGGYKTEPYLINRVTTTEGKVLYSRKTPSPQRVLAPEIAYAMNGMLENVVRHGTGKNAQIPNWPVAGKTGTSQAFRDALFVGYTPNLVTGVWLGNDDNSPTKKITGGSLPAQIWQSVMQDAHNDAALSNYPRVTVPVPQVESPDIAERIAGKRREGMLAFLQNLLPFGKGGEGQTEGETPKTVTSPISKSTSPINRPHKIPIPYVRPQNTRPQGASSSEAQMVRNQNQILLQNAKRKPSFAPTPPREIGTQ